MDILLTIFWGLVVLIVLVVVHELGHFIAARAFKVRVTEFMIGLPGPNIGFEHNGCKYGVTCIPLGGYNRICGMESGPENPNLQKVLSYVWRHGKADTEHVSCACGLSEDDAFEALVVLDGWGSIVSPKRSNTKYYCAPKTQEYALGQAREVADEKVLLDSERSHTCRGLSPWKRLVVLFSGPIANLLLALIIFLVLFCVVGMPYATNTIDSVVNNTPAAYAGLESDDVIIAANGVSVNSLSDITNVLSTSGEDSEIVLEIERDGQQLEKTIKPYKDTDGKLKLGFYAKQGSYRLNVVQGLQATWIFISGTIEAYSKLFNPATIAETVSQSSSVVGISVMAKQAAGAGAFNLFYLLAIISLSLCVINLVPMPPLDGGKIVVEVIQKFIRRDIPARVINVITVVVLVLLAVLFIAVLKNDIARFIGG